MATRRKKRRRRYTFQTLILPSVMQHINPINIKEMPLLLNENGFVINDIKYNVTKKYQKLFPKGWFGYCVALFAVKGE